MDPCAVSASEAGVEKDSAIDFSLRKAPLDEYPQESGATSRANTNDPMKLWYTVDTDPRTAKKIALESLSYASIDQSVYIMLQVDCPFASKFEYLNIQDLVHTNLRNGMTLMELSDCLRLLAKYAKELLKPSGERYKNWNKIPFLKSGSPQKWTRMEGTAPILHQIGYTQGTSKGYVFPLTSYGPPLALIKVIALELATSAAELSVFYNNRHPKAENSKQVISAMLYARKAEPSQTEQSPVFCSSSRPFNVMDLLGSNAKTDTSFDESESKPKLATSSPLDDSMGGDENPRKRRRSNDLVPLKLPTTSFTCSEPTEVLSPDSVRGTTSAESDQFSYNCARQLDASASYGYIAPADDRSASSSSRISESMRLPSIAQRCSQRPHSDTTANYDAGRQFQQMMPAALPNLSILGNMFSNSSQKFTDNV